MLNLYWMFFFVGIFAFSFNLKGKRAVIFTSWTPTPLPSINLWAKLWLKSECTHWPKIMFTNSLSQDLKLALHFLVALHFLELLWTLAPEIDAEQKTGICQHFLENMSVLDIFHTQAAEQWTMEDIYSRLYRVNIRSPHIKFLPADIDRLRLPNILKSSLFSSPWAES